MKIAIEAQRIFRFNKHGMDFVALEVIRALQKIDNTNEYYIIVAPGGDKCLEPTSNFHIIETGGANYFIWEQYSLPKALKKIKPDILHCTSNTAPLYTSCQLVVTLHDIIYLQPKMGKNQSLYQNLGRLYRRWVVPRIIQQARTIITVSNYEKEQISNAISVDPTKLKVIYNGVGKQFRVMDKTQPIQNKYMANVGYLFMLGNTDPKKNLYTALQAYALYVKENLHPRPLLLADIQEKYLDYLLTKGNIQLIKPHIYLVGYIPNVDLPQVYNNAHLFFYPSLRESFGLPVLEAMACGIPVVTSTTSSLPEVAGEGAALVPPQDPKAMANVLSRLETDTAYYQELVDYGLQRYKQFSWENTATETLKIYQFLYNEKP